MSDLLHLVRYILDMFLESINDVNSFCLIKPLSYLEPWVYLLHNLVRLWSDDNRANAISSDIYSNVEISLTSNFIIVEIVAMLITFDKYFLSREIWSLHRSICDLSYPLSSHIDDTTKLQFLLEVKYVLHLFVSIYHTEMQINSSNWKFSC
jgi:hypothetical protein